MTWIVAILVLLPCGYFFFWLFSSTFNLKPEIPTSVAVAQLVEDEHAVSSPPGTTSVTNATQVDTTKGGGPSTALSEEQKGIVFMHTLGFGKGIEWAKTYRRGPTKAEYVSIVAFATPDDPTNFYDLKLQDAFLTGFKAGCQHGLELQKSAF